MSEPDYVVIRDPENERLSGRWYDLAGVDWPQPVATPATPCPILYVPTPFIEVREDGAVAQVYMRRPEPKP